MTKETTMTDANPRAVIGANQPPALDVLLADRHAKLVKDKKAWLKKAEAANLTPKTEAEVMALEKLFVDGDDLIKDAAKNHTAEKEPYLRDGKIVDKFFNAGIRDAVLPLAGRVKTAALTWRNAEADKERKRLADEAERTRKAALDLQEKANAAAARGETKLADVYEARAEAKDNAADIAQAASTQQVARHVGGGVSTSATTKKECTGILRADLDLEPLRYLLKEADLIAAVNQIVKSGAAPPKGAVMTEVVTGRISRR